MSHKIIHINLVMKKNLPKKQYNIFLMTAKNSFNHQKLHNYWKIGLNSQYLTNKHPKCYTKLTICTGSWNNMASSPCSQCPWQQEKKNANYPLLTVISLYTPFPAAGSGNQGITTSFRPVTHKQVLNNPWITVRCQNNQYPWHHTMGPHTKQEMSHSVHH